MWLSEIFNLTLSFLCLRAVLMMPHVSLWLAGRLGRRVRWSSVRLWWWMGRYRFQTLESVWVWEPSTSGNTSTLCLNPAPSAPFFMVLIIISPCCINEKTFSACVGLFHLVFFTLLLSASIRRLETSVPTATTTSTTSSCPASPTTPCPAVWVPTSARSNSTSPTDAGSARPATPSTTLKVIYWFV